MIHMNENTTFQAEDEVTFQLVRKRAVIYSRVSTDDQNCERQTFELTEYANRANYQIVAIFEEKASGAKDDRPERKKILNLAQKREIDIVLVSEMTRWGRSTQDLLKTLGELQAKNCFVEAMNGVSFDLSTPHGKLIATVLSAISEFERDLIRERVKSGLANARRRGKKLGRQVGEKVVQKKFEKKVIQLKNEGRSYRWIAKELQISKTTCVEIMKEYRAKEADIA